MCYENYNNFTHLMVIYSLAVGAEHKMHFLYRVRWMQSEEEQFKKKNETSTTIQAS